MLRTDLEEYLEKRTRDIEEKLHRIFMCRETEMKKPYEGRDMNVLYMLHKDQVLYEFCLREFRFMKQQGDEEQYIY
jgi:hypothetical protein